MAEPDFVRTRVQSVFNAFPVSAAGFAFAMRAHELEELELSVLVGAMFVSEALKKQGSTRGPVHIAVPGVPWRYRTGSSPSNINHFYRLFLVRAAELLNLYLADLLLACFRLVPDALRTKEQVSYSEILDFRDVDALRRHLAQRTVESAARGGYRELREVIRKRLALPISIETDAEQSVSELVSLRNILVHNDGKVDAQFVAETASARWKLGQTVALDGETVTVYYERLLGFVRTIDLAAVRQIANLDLARQLPGERRG